MREKEEKIGKIRTIYNETYENGVLVQSGKGAPTQIGEAVVVEKKEQGVIRVGTKLTYLVGTGNYVWPVDYPYITVDFGGYYGHTGTDFVNLYEKYCAVYAVESGEEHSDDEKKIYRLHAGLTLLHPLVDVVVIVLEVIGCE